LGEGASGGGGWAEWVSWWLSAPLPGPVLTGNWVGAPGDPGGGSRGGIVRRPAQDGPLGRGGDWVERAQEVPEVEGELKLEIVLASLRGDRSIAELCREHDIAESLLREWRDRAVDAATERFEAGQERSLQSEQRRRIARLERALGRKTYELEIAGEALRGWE
jgi:transposase